ncbi:MAG: BON domain-containing protein [Aeromicrobium sp.]
MNTVSRGETIAASVRSVLRAAPYVPEDDIAVEVREHVVYLSGTVKWEHQRVAAEWAVEHLAGVDVVRNQIRVLPRVSADETKAKVLAALACDGGCQSPSIEVDVDGETVTLAGAVGSYTDRRCAEQAARSMPHVRAVSNELRIVRA